MKNLFKVMLFLIASMMTVMSCESTDLESVSPVITDNTEVLSDSLMIINIDNQYTTIYDTVLKEPIVIDVNFYDTLYYNFRNDLCVNESVPNQKILAYVFKADSAGLAETVDYYYDDIFNMTSSILQSYDYEDLGEIYYEIGLFQTIDSTKNDLHGFLNYGITDSTISSMVIYFKHSAQPVNVSKTSDGIYLNYNSVVMLSCFPIENSICETLFTSEIDKIELNGEYVTYNLLFNNYTSINYMNLFGLMYSYTY